MGYLGRQEFELSFLRAEFLRLQASLLTSLVFTVVIANVATTMSKYQPEMFGDID